MSNNKLNYKIINVAALVLLFYFGFLSIKIGWDIIVKCMSLLAPFIVGFVFAYSLTPLVRWLQKKGLNKALAVIIVILGLLIIVAGLIAIVVPLLYDQTILLGKNIIEVFDNFSTNFNLNIGSFEIKLTDYLNDRQIFEAINSSEKVGISGDVMASMITGEFKSTGGMPAGDDVYVPKGFVPPKADPVKDYERGVEADTSSVADLKQRIEDVKERENDAIESAMIEMEFQEEENPNFYGNAETMEEKAKIMAEKVQEEAKKQLRESGLVEEQSKLEDQLRKQYEKMVDDAEAYFGEMEAYAQKIKEVDADYEKRITELRTELENMRQNPDASQTMIQDVELVVQKLEGERKANGERAKQVKESFAQYASGDQFAGVREAYANDGRGNTPSFSDKQTTIDNMQSDMDRIVKRSKV